MRDINCKPNQNEVFIWNIMGSLFNSLLSVITLMVVTRMLQSDEADIFSIGWSISQIMATIGTYQIRMYQATDVTEKFKFGQYLIFRIFTLIVMIVCSVGYLLSKHYDIYKTIISPTMINFPFSAVRFWGEGNLHISDELPLPF